MALEWSLVLADLEPRVRQEIRAMSDTIELLKTSLVAVEAKKQKLQEALIKYGEHRDDCPHFGPHLTTEPCTCGLDTILKMEQPATHGYTIVWARHDEVGCLDLGEHWISNLDELVPTLVDEVGQHPCDVRVFKGSPCFSRWDRSLNDQFVARRLALDEEAERREYQRLKAKFEGAA